MMDLHFFCISLNFRHETKISFSSFHLAQKHCPEGLWESRGRGSKWSCVKGKHIPLPSYKSFRGLVHTVVLTLPRDGTTLHSGLSDTSVIARETTWLGGFVVIVCFPGPLRNCVDMMCLLTHREDSYSLPPGKPGRLKMEKSMIINSMQN